MLSLKEEVDPNITILKYIEGNTTDTSLPNLDGSEII